MKTYRDIVASINDLPVAQKQDGVLVSAAILYLAEVILESVSPRLIPVHEAGDVQTIVNPSAGVPAATEPAKSTPPGSVAVAAPEKPLTREDLEELAKVALVQLVKRIGKDAALGAMRDGGYARIPDYPTQELPALIARLDAIEEIPF
jgi:hypothetical protein